MADASELVGSLAEGFLDSRCLHVAVNLGLADAVSDEPRSIVDVARRVGADARALTRVVRHLTALGVFSLRGDEIVHNDASRLLREDDSSSLAPLIRMMSLPVMWNSLERLEDAVRTGRPGTSFLDPGGFFAYLDAHPQESAVYDQGMEAMTVRRIARTVPHYDFTSFERIADIGGGRGHLLRAVLAQAPHARGVLFDRAPVLENLPPDPRVEIRAGDFFRDPLPPADCYLLSNIIHDWSDEDSVSILSSLRAAASPSCTLLLFEFVLPADAGDFDASDIDIWMLALVGGRERRLSEYADLLGRAGWQVARTVPTPVQTIIEATPVP